MYINHCFIIICLFQYVLTSDTNPKKTNIRGKKNEHAQKTINNFDYRKYYKDLFQSADMHPKQYGNDATNANKQILRENFNDDVEHDKHSLIFQQVYNMYKRVLDRRKAELNKTSRIQKSKNKINAHVNKLQEAMRKKISRLDYLNHKQIIKERKYDNIQEKKQNMKSLNDNVTADYIKSEDRAKGIDLLKVKNILSDVENYVYKKVGNVDQQETDKNSKYHRAMGHIENKNASHEPIRNDVKTDLKGKIQSFFGFKKDSSTNKHTKRTKTTTRRPTTPDLYEWAFNNTDSSSEEVKCKGDGFWSEMKNRRVNLTRRARMKTTWSSAQADEYWMNWTPDPRYTFGLEEWNGSHLENQTFQSYEEENATFTTLPANWLTWLYSGVSEDLANQTTYESCPTNEIYDRYYNTTWSVEFQHTAAKNQTFLWPHKDMFKYTFHTSDASEWDELEFHPFPPNKSYYERNRIKEYLTWHPVKRADFVTTQRQPSTWTELFYTNNSAEGVYVAPTLYWIDLRTPSKRTFGSWEQVESNEVTKPPRRLPPYPDPPINFTCYHCNGTPAMFSHENNLNNHILEHMKNGTYKVHFNSSEERRAQEIPTWDSYFMMDQDSEDKAKGITQTRLPDCTYCSSIDYSYEMRNWNQSFIEKMKKRHAEGKCVEHWDQDSVVYNYYYEQRRTTTVIYDSDYYYNSEEWEELKRQRKRREEKEKLMKNLKAYMAQKLTTFPDSFTEPSEELQKKKKSKLIDSLELFKREYLRNLTRTTQPTPSTTPEPILDIMKDLASIYQRMTDVTVITPTTKKLRPFIIQDQLNKYAYSDTIEDYAIG